jgi:SAM-dependent methyltransferase
MQYAKHKDVNFDTLFNKIGGIKPDEKSKLEIEVRYYIDERKKADIYCNTYNTDKTIAIAKKLIKKYADKPAVVSQTINFLHGIDVKQMSFLNGIQQKDKLIHYRKSRIIKPLLLAHNTLPMCRFTASFETTIPEFPASSSKSARIRLRYTIQVTDEWQLDITLVKNVTDFSNPAKLPSAKAQMLFTIDTATFAEKAPWNLTDIIEFELEYVGKRFTVNSLTEINNIFDFLDFAADEAPISSAQSDNYQQTIYQIAKFIRPAHANRFQHSDGLKQLSNQVIELDKNMFLKDVMPNITDYYITDKVDGARAILYISGNECKVVTKELNSFTLDSNNKNTYILDCEEYEEQKKGETQKVYYVFDVMIFEGKSQVNNPFHNRLKLFDSVMHLSSRLRTKPFVQLTDKFQAQIAKFKQEQMKKPYETDGIILTPTDGKYVDMQVYKYKPIDKLSVDFVIKRCPDKLLGITPYIAKPKQTLYLLFSGMRHDTFKQLNLSFIRNYEDIFPGIDARRPPNYFPYQFQPSDFTFAYLYWDKNEALDGEIGEFVCTACIHKKPINAENNIWELHKIRSDRKVEMARGNYYGNNYKVAELTWMSYKDPLVIEELDTSDLYFQQHDNVLQKASRHFNSFVKVKIFEQFKNTEWTIDIASGKGQDVFRYATYAFKNLVFLEINNTALIELISRKFDLRRTNPMNVQIHQMDMTNDYKDNIQKLTDDINIPTTGVDLIICNFAFHYFLKDSKSLKNVLKFIDHYLKPGGRFIFTAFDAKDIIQLLNAHDGNWTIMQGKEIQYSIKKEYKTTLLEAVGQKIDVLLPFSNKEYYTEYLVNIDHIAGEFEKLGFILENNQSFGEYLDEYKDQNTTGFQSMTADDKKYSSLYHYYCFYKKKSGGSKRR